MSYSVLARKYRPRNFAALLGQQHVVQALSNALDQQRLHHAYLFTGTRGVGKTSIARILAKSLNCQGPDGAGSITSHPCGQCVACTEIDAGCFVDYVELDAASNRGVDEISQLLAQAVYHPVVGRFKIYLIDEVHMLSNTAFNAMLKTLEEPPDHLKFILATTDPQKIPATVLSRCLQFHLKPLAPATVQANLAQVLEQEGLEAQAGALRLLAHAAQGSMRDALSLTDQAIAYGAGVLTQEGVGHMLGVVDAKQAQTLLTALIDCDGKALISHCQILREQGLSASGVIEECARLLQSAAIFQVAPDALKTMDGFNLTEQADIDLLAKGLTAQELQLFYTMCMRGRAELCWAPDEYSGLVMLFLRMLAFRLPRTGLDGAPQTELQANSDSPLNSGSWSLAPESLPLAPAISPELTQSADSVNSVDKVDPLVIARQNQVYAQQGPNLIVEPLLDSHQQNLDSTPMHAQACASTPVVTLSSDFDPDLGHDSNLYIDQAWPKAHAATLSLDCAQYQGHDILTTRTSSQGSKEVSKEVVAQTQWCDVVAQLLEAKKISALVRELALNAQCFLIEEHNTRWHLRVDNEILMGASHCAKLETLIGDYVGQRVSLILHSGAVTDTLSLRELAYKQNRQKQAEQIIYEDPWIGSLLSRYPGSRIVPGSIQAI